MTGEEFAKNMEVEIMEETFNRYFSMLKTIDKSTINNQLWKKVAALYDSVNAENKENIQALVRLVMIDVISNIFGKLDGISSFADQSYPLEVKCGDDVISGDLQETFLMNIEDKGYLDA
jgi:hypothetical protein